jgi:glucosamine kinase
MNSIALFEAGGTKTTLLIDTGSEVKQYFLPGFNPNRYSKDFENELVKIDLSGVERIIFYGSGLTSSENKKRVNELLKQFSKAAKEIYDDQIGAARAVFGNQKGLIAIMGTGAFAAWYNGNELEDRRGGYGYLIDDIGGGLELGKYVFSLWMNNDLPHLCDQELTKKLAVRKEEFTTWFYKNPDLKLLAEIPKMIHPFLNDAVMRTLIGNYFKLFFERHINPCVIKYKPQAMGVVGGFADAFEDILSETAAHCGIKELIICREPGLKLLEFHKQKGI